MAVKLLAMRRSCLCARCAETITAGARAWWNSDDSSHSCVNCRPAERRDGQRAQPGVASSLTTHDAHSAQSLSATPPDGSWLRTLLSTLGAAGALPVTARFGENSVIDAVIVASTGVWVVGSIDDSGRIELRDAGHHTKYDWRVFVGGVDRTRVLGEVDWAAGEVERRTDVHRLLAGVERSVVNRVLCVPNADASASRTPLVHEGVWVIPPALLVERVSGAGPLDPGTVRRLAAECERRLRVE